MKKSVILSGIFGVIALPAIVFGAFKIEQGIKNIAANEFIANVQTQGKGNILLYKYTDPLNASTTCYIAEQEFGNWANTAISCVK